MVLRSKLKMVALKEYRTVRIFHKIKKKCQKFLSKIWNHSSLMLRWNKNQFLTKLAAIPLRKNYLNVDFSHYHISKLNISKLITQDYTEKKVGARFFSDRIPKGPNRQGDPKVITCELVHGK